MAERTAALTATSGQAAASGPAAAARPVASRALAPRALAPATALLAALCAAALWAAVCANPAAAWIQDGAAEPAHSFVVHGDDAMGGDYALDVTIGKKATYVAGYGDYVGAGVDATLTIISHATWTATTFHYDNKSRNDEANAVAVGPDGSVYTAGSSADATQADMLVIKWSKAGKVVWARRYDGPAKGNDYSTDIGIDGSGNVIVCGPSTGTHGFDWAVVSWTKSGKRRWVWRWDGSGHFTDDATGLVVDKKGRAYVSGTIYVAGPLSAAGVAKLSSTGKKIWRRTYTGPIGGGADAHRMCADGRGGVVVCGWEAVEGHGRDAMVMGYSSKGRQTLYRALSAAEDEGTDSFSSVCVTTKSVVAVGARNAPGEAADPIRAKYTLGQWDYESSPGPSTVADDRWNDVVADSFGGYVMGGSYGFSPTGTSVHTWRDTTLDGGMRWRTSWIGPSAAPHSNGALAVATRGMMVASVGYEFTDENGWDQIILIWVY